MRRLQRFLPHSYWLIGATAGEMLYRALTLGPQWLAFVAGVYVFAFVGAAAGLVLYVPRDRL